MSQERLDWVKRGWEMKHLQKLRCEEEERLLVEGEEDLFTYTREDAYNMVGCWGLHSALSHSIPSTNL